MRRACCTCWCWHMMASTWPASSWRLWVSAGLACMGHVASTLYCKLAPTGVSFRLPFVAGCDIMQACTQPSLQRLLHMLNFSFICSRSQASHQATLVRTCSSHVSLIHSLHAPKPTDTSHASTQCSLLNTHQAARPPPPPSPTSTTAWCLWAAGRATRTSSACTPTHPTPRWTPRRMWRWVARV